jgi:hypothetical protein
MRAARCLTENAPKPRRARRGRPGTDGDTVLGVVIRDRVDDNFSWLMLTCNDEGPGYTAIDLGASLPTREAATRALHAAMEQRA